MKANDDIKKPKRTYNTKPTSKQRILARKILENNSTGKPINKLMVEAGYSKNTAIASTEITGSKGLQQALMEIGATPDKLADVFNQGINANRVDIIKGQSEMSTVPDVALRVKTAETVAKLYGFTPDKQGSGNTYNTFIQQNQLDPNKVEGRDLVSDTLDMLMNATKRNNTNEGIIDQETSKE